MYEKRSEKGQVLILIVLAIVALFGFSALAVDGGRLYSERRRAQTAADAAAFAAALAAVSGEATGTAALNQALLNDFNNDGVSNVVSINNPPASGPYAGMTEYYQVIVTSNVAPIFSQFVYNKPLQVTAEAVAFARGSASASAGNAVHALSASGDALEFKGNVDVHVIGGNIYSNANGKKSGGSGTVKVTGGEVLVRGSWSGDTSGVNPKPKTSYAAQTIPPIPPPDCNVSAGTQSGNKLTPGKFTSGISLSGGGKNNVWTMDPGIYCIYNGLTVNGGVELRGKGVMIVMMSGTLKLNGNGIVNITRASALKDKSGTQWGGMLIYVHPSNTSDVFLSGGNNTQFSGTVYAPSSECEVGGNVDTMGFKANIICNTVVFHGNPDITLDYKQPQNYRLQPLIELVK